MYLFSGEYGNKHDRSISRKVTKRINRPHKLPSLQAVLGGRLWAIKTMKRNEKIKKFGLEIVEYDEEIWRKRGYTVDYDKNLLKQITEQK